MRRKRRKAKRMIAERTILDADVASTEKREKQYWTYVDPIKGKYSLSNTDPAALVLFPNEEEGRKLEQRSKCLRELVGHYVTAQEAKEIAESESDGRIVLCADGCFHPITLL